MRLWHYKLIPVLPNAMLVSQWRECIAIKRQWEKGTLKHRLVSYVKNCNRCYFRNYVRLVKNEMIIRNIKTNYDLYAELIRFTNEDGSKGVNNEYYIEHNDRYLKQCYYNLQEKYDRGIITFDEWKKIKQEMIGELYE